MTTQLLISIIISTMFGLLFSYNNYRSYKYIQKLQQRLQELQDENNRNI